MVGTEFLEAGVMTMAELLNFLLSFAGWLRLSEDFRLREMFGPLKPFGTVPLAVPEEEPDEELDLKMF